MAAQHSSGSAGIHVFPAVWILHEVFCPVTWLREAARSHRDRGSAPLIVRAMRRRTGSVAGHHSHRENPKDIRRLHCKAGYHPDSRRTPPALARSQTLEPASVHQNCLNSSDAKVSMPLTAIHESHLTMALPTAMRH